MPQTSFATSNAFAAVLGRWRACWPVKRPLQPRSPEPAPAGGTAVPPASPVVDADALPWFGGCGWFDSSHELSQGLQVQELDTPEGLAEALPLPVWLEHHLQA